MKDQFRITKDQILELSKSNSILKEWFPSVFNNELIVGKWYKKEGYLIKWNGEDDTYGFWNDKYGSDWAFRDNWSLISPSDLVEATDEEVEQALINEATKRGYKKGCCIKRKFDFKLKTVVIDADEYPLDDEYNYNLSEDYLEYLGFVIYSKGMWAEIIPTMTKEEAEKILNVKII